MDQSGGGGGGAGIGVKHGTWRIIRHDDQKLAINSNPALTRDRPGPRARSAEARIKMDDVLLARREATG